MAKNIQYRRAIPREVIAFNPRLTMHEIRSIINRVMNLKTNVLTQSSQFKVHLKGICTLRTHGNKKLSYAKGIKKTDREKKRRMQRKLELSKERLLW